MENIPSSDVNVTAYFEAMYTSAEDSAISSPPQLFLDVPAMNPYNLCNPMAENGVDCGLAQDALFTNPVYTAGFGAYYEGFVHLTVFHWRMYASNFGLHRPSRCSTHFTNCISGGRQVITCERVGNY